MAVRFIAGRAGTGKTHHCLSAIRRRLRHDPADGPRLILLVPEQAGLQMERALLDTTPGDDAAEPIRAAHRAEVLSFRRLAFRVLDSVGATVGVALTESARAMVLRHLAIQHADELCYYGRIARPGRKAGRLSGFIDRLGATINELIEEAIEPEELASLVNTSDDPPQQATLFDRPGARDPAQQAKLHDVVLLYKAYRAYLGPDRIDPSQYLQVARGVLSQCPWLQGAELWVDGFASFSGQERLTLLELTRLCSNTEITALIDPALLDERTVAKPTRSPARRNGSATYDRFATQRLFARVHRTHQDLSRAFTQAGIEQSPPLVLDSPQPPRFRCAPELARIERSLFTTPAEPTGDRNPESSNTRAVPGEIETVEPLTSRDLTDRQIKPVRIVELPDRRTEVDFAVSRIVSWVQDPHRPYRYRDVAIIVRDLDLYHDLLSEALHARGIPYFIDRRRPVLHHPLVEWLRLAPAVLADSLSLETVRLLLKTDLLGLSRDACDELENYLVAHGIQGIDAWRDGPWNYRRDDELATQKQPPDSDESARMERINATRAHLVHLLDPWLRTNETNPAPTGAEWSKALISFLQRLNVGAALRAWSERAQADGDVEASEVHEQIWKDASALLHDLAFALGATPLAVRDLAEVLDAGLSGLTLGLVPPTVDQVLVGSIERSRHPDIKAAVIVGLNEGVFPARPAEDAILNDDDRAWLQDAGLRIGPPTQQRVVDESSLFYIAMSRASDAAVLTLASADEAGRSLRPSPYLRELRAAHGGLEIERIPDARRERSTWDILSTGDLRERMAHEFRFRATAPHDDAVVRARWNELYAWGRCAFVDDPAYKRALSSLIEDNAATLAPQSIEALYDGPLRTSVSRLETYAACPFQYFARYALQLRERETASLRPVDMGKVHHAVLEEFMRSVVERGIDWTHLDSETAVQVLNDSCRRIAVHLPDDARVSSARNAYLLRRSAAQLGRVLTAQRQSGGVGRAKPRGAELGFGTGEPGSLPALELSTPKGRRILLRGFIDRVDLAEVSDELLGVVIDYKRKRDKRLDLSQVFHGLSLQLIAYLLVLAEHGRTLAGRPIRPIGAFFVGLRSNYRTVDGPNDTNAIERTGREAHRPRGLIRFEDVGAIDASVTDAGRSSHYTIARKKDGGLSDVNRSDGASAGDFDAVLAYTRHRLGTLADEILDGNVAVKPYRLGQFTPCSWCAMAGVCRFEWGISAPRFLEPMKRSDVLARLAVSESG